ncbi:Uncharacterised protein [Shewanella morhuae]|uniref:Uncharacterized protein n=1 Tax=Shewanella morhuae TaxID=365591 RepID=A0A380BVK5_9GAMM|nr:Uncharacterised protein [Shewanella morhuae]
MKTLIKEKRASGVVAVYEMRNGIKVLIGASWIMSPLLKR